MGWAPVRADLGLLDGDSLVVPIIDLNVWHKYVELEGRSLTNLKWSDKFLAVAEQGIRFRLDEGGARLESAAYLEAKKRAVTEPR